jgi:hypothetical protein
MKQPLYENLQTLRATIDTAWGREVIARAIEEIDDLENRVRILIDKLIDADTTIRHLRDAQIDFKY